MTFQEVRLSLLKTIAEKDLVILEQKQKLAEGQKK